MKKSLTALSFKRVTGILNFFSMAGSGIKAVK
jgi:hypothetical protein